MNESYKNKQHVRMERALTLESDLDLNSNSSCIMLGVLIWVCNVKFAYMYNIWLLPKVILSIEWSTHKTPLYVPSK